jgi:hypothetical protein
MNDEQIAKHAAAEQEAERRSVTDGEVRIGGRAYNFQERELFAGKLRVPLPETFTDMPEELAAVKYPSADRPKIILSDERGAAAFTFNRIDNPLNAASVERLASEMRMLLQKMNPSYLFFEEQDDGENEAADAGSETEEPKVAVSSISYKSPALDEAVYNVMFFVPLEGKTMMGTFSCPYGEHAEWKPVVSEVCGRIKTRETEEEEPC